MSDPAASLLSQSRESFARLTDVGALLALHVRSEGRILFDREHWLEEQLAATRNVEPDPGWTLDWASHELTRLTDLDRFNGVFLFALARLFTLARAVAIAMTVREGVPEFAKDRPFAVSASHHPDQSQELLRLSALRPFHERASGKEVNLPFEHLGAVHEVQTGIDDLRRVIAAQR